MNTLHRIKDLYKEVERTTRWTGKGSGATAVTAKASESCITVQCRSTTIMIDHSNALSLAKWIIALNEEEDK